MANLNRQRGLEVAGEPRRIRPYIASGTIYPGDPVTTASTGKVASAAATTALLGVAVSYATDGNQVLVADHPDQEFVIAANSALPASQTDLLLNYDIVSGTPNSTYKRSSTVLNSTSGATTATLPLKLLAIEPRDNNAFGANVDCVVVINNHQLKGGTGTAGT